MSQYGTRVPPANDFPLADWAQTASERISERAGDYQVSVAQAEEFASLTESYQEALSKAYDPATKGPLATSGKRRAKQDLLDFAMPLMRMIANNVNVDVEAREQLGLRPRKPRTPGQKPTNQPDTDVLSTTPTSVRFRAHNGDALVRRLPPGVLGMMVWTHVGPVPDPEVENWTCRGLYTRPTATLEFSGISVGTKVWIAVAWVNGHGQGPKSYPIELILAGQSFAQQFTQQMPEEPSSQAA
jgi:hypothetical protein